MIAAWSGVCVCVCTNESLHLHKSTQHVVKQTASNRNKHRKTDVDELAWRFARPLFKKSSWYDSWTWLEYHMQANPFVKAAVVYCALCAVWRSKSLLDPRN